MTPRIKMFDVDAHVGLGFIPGIHLGARQMRGTCRDLLCTRGPASRLLQEHLPANSADWLICPYLSGVRYGALPLESLARKNIAATNGYESYCPIRGVASAWTFTGIGQQLSQVHHGHSPLCCGRRGDRQGTEISRPTRNGPRSTCPDRQRIFGGIEDSTKAEETDLRNISIRLVDFVALRRLGIWFKNFGVAVCEKLRCAFGSEWILLPGRRAKRPRGGMVSAIQRYHYPREKDLRSITDSSLASRYHDQWTWSSISPDTRQIRNLCAKGCLHGFSSNKKINRFVRQAGRWECSAKNGPLERIHYGTISRSPHRSPGAEPRPSTSPDSIKLSPACKGLLIGDTSIVGQQHFSQHVAARVLFYSIPSVRTTATPGNRLPLDREPDPAGSLFLLPPGPTQKEIENDYSPHETMAIRQWHDDAAGILRNRNHQVRTENRRCSFRLCRFGPQRKASGTR